MRGREKKMQRTMKKVYLVFCEGETEAVYIDFVRREYHSPIKIVSKTEGNKISPQLISRHQSELKNSKNDVIDTFLMYDLDVASVNDKLRTCNAIWLCSNPCIELWFLLHCKSQTAAISSAKCVQELKKAGKEWSDYHKSVLTNQQALTLKTNIATAIKRAKSLEPHNNPSTTIYRLIETIEAAK